MKKKAWQITAADNVAVVVTNVDIGDMINWTSGTAVALEAIPLGHKVAIGDIATGEMAVKYGVSIGRATRNIRVGEHVHTQNLQDITEELCTSYHNAFMERED